MELLYRAKFMPRNGTGAVVILPTRELALQIYNVARDVMQHHTQTHGATLRGGDAHAGYMLIDLVHRRYSRYMDSYSSCP